MEELNNEVYNSITSYFNTLSKTGYINNCNTKKLLVYIFANDILNGLFGNSIPEEDYKTITNALYCLYGTSCLLPYPKYTHYTSLQTFNTVGMFRKSETCILRYTENDNIRIVNH